MTIGPVVYIIGTLIMFTCAFLLFRAYARVRKRLLFWSGLCFAGLSLSHLLRFVDLVIVPDVDLYRARLVVAALSIALLLYGLIRED